MNPLDHLVRYRRLLTELTGAAIVSAALALSFLLRFEFTVPEGYLPMLARALPLALGVKLVVFRVFSLRHLAWRHLGFDDLLRVAGANLAASLAFTVATRLALGSAFPRSIYVLDFMLCLGLEVATRSAMRMVFEASRHPAAGCRRRVLIFGAGQAGILLARELRTHPEMGYDVVGLLDDDPAKRDMRVRGHRIWGGRGDMQRVALRLAADELLIALPNASGDDLTAILEQAHAARLTAKRVPALAELIDSRVLAGQIREVRIEDLLGRPPARLDETALRGQITGQVVLVTGAGGSIGSELTRQLARHAPAALIGFDQAETALYEIEQELRVSHPDVLFVAEVGSVQSRQRLEEVFARHRPRLVYHAAAYKHVPMMEAHLFEAVQNNIFGTRNVVRAAAAWGAAGFVMISTDKAVRPTNVMGATKRAAELVCLLEASGSARAREGTPLRTTSVRFGNVLGSNGSVVPRFRQQIAAGGPVTVTHPDMRRYFMTIPEAAQLVLQAGAMGDGGQIFVLDMGEPVRILDLARKLILLSGLRPDSDIPIVFSGLRPGEKMYEELSAYEENTVPTPHTQIRVFTGALPNRARAEQTLDQLRNALMARDAAGLLIALKELVPDYNPSNAILREAFATRAEPKARSVVA
jgi:FlaA1/EpsC-like NDP-sugar epimerase